MHTIPQYTKKNVPNTKMNMKIFHWSNCNDGWIVF